MTCFKDMEAILFDFEGTLVDFQWNKSRAVRETLEMLASSGFSTDRIQYRTYSTLMREATKTAPEIGWSPDHIRNKIDVIYDRYDEDALSRWTVRSKAKEFLHLLKTKNIRIGLVSNVGKGALKKAFSRLKLEDFFGVIVSRNDVRTLKPSGEGIHLALRHLKIEKEKALFIGDSLDDIYAARDAGVKVAIIAGGETPKDEILSAGPDCLVRSFDELIGMIPT